MCVDVEMREGDVWGDAEDGVEAVLHQMCARTHTVYIDRHAETHTYTCRHAYGHAYPAYMLHLHARVRQCKEMYTLVWTHMHICVHAHIRHHTPHRPPACTSDV